MSSFKQAVRYSQGSSRAAATLVLARLFLVNFLILRGHAHVQIAICVISVSVLSLAIPVCGYVGAKRGKPSLLLWFAGCSYGSGCFDCALMCHLLVILSVLVDMRHIVHLCDVSDEGYSCPKEVQPGLVRQCVALDDSVFQNDSWRPPMRWDKNQSFEVAHNVSFLRINEEKLEVEHCLLTLGNWGTVGLLMVIAYVIVQGFALCCHCCTGIYGVELYTMCKEDDYGDRDNCYDTDSSDSSRSTDLSDDDEL
uniref:Uncharacterized protein n=1 Tax=Zooxanthella nutricula TaxID=1333877 RepID=A0A6V0I8C4_9DINO